jgi:ATP-dependent RNA helicase DDX21
MIDVLRKKGVKNLFPVQYRTFKQLFQGKDLMVRDKTGSGKTLAFALPIIQRLRA